MAKIATKTTGTDGVVFTFTGGHVLSVSLSALKDETIERLAVHGLSQKIGDSYSGAESIETAVAAAEGVWSNLKAGKWAVKASRGGVLVDALMRVTGKTFEECLAKVQGMDEKAKKALKRHPDIMAALADIQKEAAVAAKEAAIDAPDVPDLGEMFT